MKREPSAFSYVRNLDVGCSAFVPCNKAYAVSCAISYMVSEYGYAYRIEQNDDNGMILITRTA